ncbi:MAG: hypothetical protein V4525_17140 [Pseudomonadota bacterium]
MSAKLELSEVELLRPWLSRLLDWGLVKQSGQTQATRYFVEPELLRTLQFPVATTLKRIEPHRLQALVLEDLHRYPESSISEINRRVGEEIQYKQLKRAIDALIETKKVVSIGDKRGRRYSLLEADIGQKG